MVFRNHLLDLAGGEMVRSDARILIPHELGERGILINKFIAPLVALACQSLFFVARPKQTSLPADRLTVLVIITARNEKGISRPRSNARPTWANRPKSFW